MGEKMARDNQTNRRSTAARFTIKKGEATVLGGIVVLIVVQL